MEKTAASLGLDPAEFHVDPDIRRAESLPPRAFLDPAVLELELATVFRRSWLLAPQRTEAELKDDPRSLAQLVRLRGSQVPFSALGQPFFLQRDWESRLHCFPNACTHAWYPLVDGPGRVKGLSCRQHGRQFDCEGRFRSQPGFHIGAEGFPRPCDDLKDLPVREWGELLFFCPGEPELAFEEALGPVMESAAGLGLAEFRRRPMAGELREVSGNWKQHAWNYMDRFHIAYIHKAPGGLADAIEPESYRTELHPRAALQWVYARDPRNGFEPDLLPGRFRDPKRRVFALWWLVFPNLTLNFYPWGLSANLYLPVPGRPDRTAFHWYHWVRDEKAYARLEEAWRSEQVDQEDVDAMAQAARGLRSWHAPRGRFAPAEETGPHWLHRLLSEALFAPAPGRKAAARRPAGRVS